eukprot:3157591-Rhodomonas_salina.7
MPTHRHSEAEARRQVGALTGVEVELLELQMQLPRDLSRCGTGHRISLEQHEPPFVTIAKAAKTRARRQIAEPLRRSRFHASKQHMAVAAQSVMMMLTGWTSQWALMTWTRSCAWRGLSGGGGILGSEGG